MSQFKPPNYNLLIYEIDDNINDFTTLYKIYKNMIINNRNYLYEMWHWFNSLTDNQLLNIGVRKSFGNYYLDFVIKVSHHTESGIIITIEKSVNGDIIKYASQSFLGGEEDE